MLSMSELAEVYAYLLSKHGPSSSIIQAPLIELDYRQKKLNNR